jgi:hypothetical protein
MQIKTALFIAIAIGCASAENATYIGCFADCGDVGGGCTQANRDLPTFFCSNGRSDVPYGYGCTPDPSIPAGGGYWAMGSAMTVATCSAMCRGFKFFGIQLTNQCFCGNDYGNQGGKKPESDCDSTCTGSPIEICGGSNRNSPAPQHVPQRCLSGTIYHSIYHTSTTLSTNTVEQAKTSQILYNF